MNSAVSTIITATLTDDTSSDSNKRPTKHWKWSYNTGAAWDIIKANADQLSTADAATLASGGSLKFT